MEQKFLVYDLPEENVTVIYDMVVFTFKNTLDTE